MKNQRTQNFNLLKGFGFACLLLFSMSTMQAQTPAAENILVQGKVVDETGPLQGVNILLQGTRIGTVTDFDGNFKFPKKLKKKDVLIFSYVGMKSQKVVIEDEKSAANIKLNIDMIVEEIIIVGAAASKKVYSSNKN